MPWAPIESGSPESPRLQQRPRAWIFPKVRANWYDTVVASDDVLRRVLSGTADAAIRFDDLCQLLERLGFERRVKGSHHVFRKKGVLAKINLQRAGAQAKPYQVKQVRTAIVEAKLGDG